MSSITLTQFTDPNCTWSWGAEPIMRHIEMLYGDQLTIEFVMGGLIEDFEEFYDSSNDISEPHEVAPHWETASQRHGMPVDVGVWHEDPPLSTYPASIATKAAERQDNALGFRYLRRLREATATERKNIAKRRTLVQLADLVGLDVDQFVNDIDDGPAEDAFEQDLRTSREHNVRGFPSFRIAADGQASMFGGYQSFERLENAVTQLAPQIEPRELPPVETFVRTYGFVATQEVAEVYELSFGKAEQVLNELVSTGNFRSLDRGNGTFWLPANDEEVPHLGTGELTLGGGPEWVA